MADKVQLKNAAVSLPTGVEKVSSFAATINPFISIVTSMVRLAKKGLKDDLATAEKQKIDEDFSAIRTKLDIISQTNQTILSQMLLNEVNETYGKYEENIKHQYSALTEMMEQIKKNPDNSQRHMEEFKKTFNEDKVNDSLKVFYGGITNKQLFGRPLLEVYFKHCDGNRNIMEARCSHLIHLFHMGLMALITYTAVTEGDEDEVKNDWEGKLEEIEDKMSWESVSKTESEVQFSKYWANYRGCNFLS
ncbi:rapunzel 2 [Centroberyx gerrardi]